MIQFRCDSSNSIGTGHVVRCLRLAKILRNIGLSSEFICLRDSGHINNKIQQEGFKVNEFNTETECIEQIKVSSPDWLIVDHYKLDSTWQAHFFQKTKIFVIDDLANRKHLCHVLLDQNYRSSFAEYDSLISKTCIRLFGPQYCLLESDLVQKNLHVFSEECLEKNILCFFGGIDSSGELVKLATNVNEDSQLKFNLVALSSHAHIDKLKNMNLPNNVVLHIDPREQWKQLLLQSDFYIGSGGTVTWERLYIGLPGAVITVADNQVIPTQDLADNNYQFYWGRSENFDYKNITEFTHQTLNKKIHLYEMAKKGRSLVSMFSENLAQQIFTNSKRNKI